MARTRPSVLLMIAALLAVAAAVWAVSSRSRPALAVYDSVPAGVAPAPATPVPSAPVPSAPRSVPEPPSTRVARPRPAAASADSARADTATADSAARADTLRHHRSDNYGGYSGYGSKERRGTPNAR